MKKFLLLVAYLLSIGPLCSPQQFVTLGANEAKEAEIASEYEKIPNEAKVPLLAPTFSERKTAKIRLDNGLEAYIISDPNSTKSGAALTVNVGSWEDPNQHPGLAHFVEHMLFMGNEKYPNESEYSSYISEHGGLANAFTTNDATSYLFTVDNQSFAGALDRFSSCFKTPLFKASAISSELHAINQEYAKNFDNDDVRLLFVLKALTNPKHPEHRFNIGDTETLKGVTHETFVNWYKKHYSANLMKLVVVSTLPMNELIPMVVKDFKGIPNHNDQPPEVNVSPDDPNALAHFIYIKPVQNIRTLTLIWNLPKKFANQLAAKPEDLVCYVLGDEGKNSLQADLKREQLAEEVQCGSIKFGPGMMTLFLEVDLTKNGLEHINRVIKRCFQSIANMKQKGIPKTLYEEVKKMATVQYEYHARENEFKTLMKDIQMLHNEPLSTFPDQSLIIQKYEPKLIHELLESLTPENAMYFISDPDVKTDQTEKWLGVKYRVAPVPEDLLKQWSHPGSNPRIGLPEKNLFIPDNLHVIKDHQEKKEGILPKPDHIFENEKCKLYYFEDHIFEIPKVSWHFYFKTPEILIGENAKVVLGDLYVAFVKDQLNQIAYPANVAGLKYNIARKDNGIALTVQGWSDKAFFLLEKILDVLENPKLSMEKFDIFKDTLLRKYQNVSKESSLQVSADMLRSLLYEHYTTDKEKASAIRKVTMKKLEQFAGAIWKSLYIEGVLYGNMTLQDSKNIFNLFGKQFNATPYPPEKQYKKEVIVLPKNKGPFYIENKSDSQGNTALLAIESPEYSFKRRAAQQILMQGIKQPFFATLRTQQKTGYIVVSYPEEIERKLFLLFAVQSNNYDPRDLLARYELFLEDFNRKLLTEKEFETIRTSIISELKHPAKNMNEMGEILQLLALDYSADFDWMQKRVEGVKDLSYQEFQDLSHEMIGMQNDRRLAILLKGLVTNGVELEYEKVSKQKLRKLSEYEPAHP